MILVQCVQAQTPASKNNDYLDREPPPVSAEARRAMEAHLSQARKVFVEQPNNPDAIIWFGRRLAYLGHFRQAIEVFTEGIRHFPSDARFLRHRGHRYITVRRFDLAIADFERATSLTRGKADEIEPDGQPNARNIPTSTLQFNILYHLGLAHYLKGENRRAVAAYRKCLQVSKNPDRLVATSHWLYMTLRRLGRDREARQVLSPIIEGMEIIENTGYYRLLLMYKGAIQSESLLEEASEGEASAASHSLLYGIGNWHLYNGRTGEAIRIFRLMVSGNQWTSFGFIAAEADLKRIS